MLLTLFFFLLWLRYILRSTKERGETCVLEVGFWIDYYGSLCGCWREAG